MRKIILAALFMILVLAPVAEVQELEYTVYIPFSGRPETMAGYWDIAIPEQAENMALNPIFGIAGNFAAVGGGTMTRVAEYGWQGLYGGRIQTAANNEGGSVTLLALTNAIHYATVRVRGTLPTVWDWSLDDAAYTTPVLLLDYDDTWSLYGLEFPAAQANASTTLYIRQNGAGAGDFYVDGVNVTLGDYSTSHVDGGQPGCEWNGAAHASTSTRSAQSRAGGRWLNLEDDFGFHITEMIDTGMPSITNISDTYALAAGGQVQGQKVHERSFSLMGKFIGTSLANLNALRQALINATKPDAVPETADGPQPFLLRYTGAAVMKKISVHYEGGLEARINGRMVCSELIPLRVFADDPYFYEFGNSAAVLDTNDTAVTESLAGRLRSTGQWNNLGMTNGANTWAMAVDPNNGDIYFAIEQVGINGVAGMDYITRYTPSANTYATVVGASAFNGAIYAFAWMPNGDLIIGGAFTNAGDANGDLVVRYTPSTDTIASLGVPATIGDVRALAVDQVGLLFIGGNYANMGGIAAADNICTWDETNYAAVDTGLTDIVRAIAVDAANIVFIGGDFPNYIKSYDGATLSDLNGGTLDDDVQALVVDNRNMLIVGGFFTASGAETLLRVGIYDGQQFIGMAGGADDDVYTLAIMPDDRVLAAGNFDEIGGLAVDKAAMWNGSSWVHLDVNMGGLFLSGTASSQSPVVSSIYDMWLGSSDAGGNAYFSGSAIVTNEGTERATPVFYIERTVGTEAIVKQVRNEDTGRTISINYALLDGERLTINLVTLAVISSFSGKVPGAILKGSDFGTFDFLSGDNQITAFVDTDATVTAWTEYTDTYWSMD